MSGMTSSDQLRRGDEDRVDTATREHLQRLYENVNLLGELGYDSTGETQYEDIKALEVKIGDLQDAVNEAHRYVTGALEPGAIGRPVREFTRGEMADLEMAIAALASHVALDEGQASDA